MDLILLQGEMRPECQRQCLEPGWSGDQPGPSESTWPS